MPTVLLIDDDRDVRQSVIAMLRSAGIDVIEGGLGADALTDVRERSYDLLLTDVVMPGVDGLVVIDAARERAPGMPIIAMSGGSGFMIAEVGLRWSRSAGASRTLTKPFRKEALLAAIAELLPPANAV